MEMKSFSNLNSIIIKDLANIRKLNKFDLIVGIPRSGIIPASIISLNLNIPLADLYSYINNIILLPHGGTRSIKNEKQKILLVDDTINTGKSMKTAIEKIKTNRPNDQIMTYAVWRSPLTDMDSIDYSSSLLSRPRIFEWNLWKKDTVIDYGFDLDGVFCKDPDIHENDKGPKLINFYKNALPKFIPKNKIGYIVTNRLEQHRAITKIWLMNNNINYRKLLMKENPAEGHIEHKIRKIKTLPIKLFIESDTRQAKNISAKIGIPVWCIDNQKLYTS